LQGQEKRADVLWWDQPKNKVKLQRSPFCNAVYSGREAFFCAHTLFQTSVTVRKFSKRIGTTTPTLLTRFTWQTLIPPNSPSLKRYVFHFVSLSLPLFPFSFCFSSIFVLLLFFHIFALIFSLILVFYSPFLLCSLLRKKKEGEGREDRRRKKRRREERREARN
jgi:hypothetical protein